MANIISNQAYEAIQVPTEVTPEVQGTILYANQFSGIGQVGMPDDLAEVLNSNLGTIGNNVLVQLEAKMAAYPPHAARHRSTQKRPARPTPRIGTPAH